MPDVTDPAVLAAVLVLALFAWRRPVAGAAFVLSGATVYYALLGLLAIEPSATLSGLVFGAAGVASTAGMLRERNRARGYRPVLVLLFACFFVLWEVRWWISPASGAIMPSSFGERAPLYMVAFAAVPFVLGGAFGAAPDRRELLRWMAIWGGAGVLILLGLVAAGQQAWDGGPASRWRPIAGISTITMSVEVGLSALALLSTARGRVGVRWTAVRVLTICIPAFMLLRIGQRGPFLFFLVAAAVFFLGNPRVRAGSRALQVTAAAGVLAAVVAGFVESTETVRPLQQGKYTAEGNADRLAVWARAFQAIGERPLLGSGGELVGTPLGASTWVYSHNILLDPFVETGVVGGTLVLALFLSLARATVRQWRRERRYEIFGLLPCFVFAMLEAQVSGHISTSKYVWLLTGALAAATAARTGAPSGRKDTAPDALAEVA